MKNFIKIFILVIGLLCFTSNMVLAEKYAPTEEINEIIELMGELEERYENNQWKEAQESVEKMEKEVKGIITHIKNDELNLQEAHANLAQALKNHNSEETEVAFIVFQSRFFSLLNDFDYDVHPILSVLEQYIIEEAGEAAEKGDFEEVVSEMRESGNLFKYAKPVLIEKGVPSQDLSTFNSKIIDLLKAGRKNNTEEVTQLLKEIQEQFKTFMTYEKK